MANNFQRSQFEFSQSGKRVRLLPKIVFAAAGAASIASGTGMGVSSIVHNSAGDYTLHLSQAYKSLLGLSCVINSGNAAPASPIMSIETDSVALSAAPLIRIQFRSLAGALTDPASGEIALMEIKLNNSSLAY